MSVAKKMNRKEKLSGVQQVESKQLVQLQADLAGLERLHSMQSTLIHEIRRQIDAMQPTSHDPQ